jgi:hypothetical protein
VHVPACIPAKGNRVLKTSSRGSSWDYLLLSPTCCGRVRSLFPDVPTTAPFYHFLY